MKCTVHLVLAVLAVHAAAPALAAGSHEHGRADLQIAVEADVIDIHLGGALDGFVGFEHRPRNAAERARVASAVAQLSSPEQLVVPPPEADCRVTLAEARDPFAEPAVGGADAAPHVELSASWQFRCRAPQALAGLRLTLFQAFPELERIDVVVLDDRGPRVHRLAPPDALLPLR